MSGACVLTVLMVCYYLLSVGSLQGGVEDIACTDENFVLFLEVLISAAGVVCIQ